MKILYLLIEIIPLLVSLFFLIQILEFIDKYHITKFKNNLLKIYNQDNISLFDIKNMYIYCFDYKKNIEDINEYDLKIIENSISKVYGKLNDSQISLFNSNLILNMLNKKTLELTKIDREKLTMQLNNISNELINEKKFFGLNKREKELFQNIINIDNFEINTHILELKDIFVNRYQELLNKEESSKISSKRSIKLGYIGLFLGIASFFKDEIIEYFTKFFN